MAIAATACYIAFDLAQPHIYLVQLYANSYAMVEVLGNTEMALSPGTWHLQPRPQRAADVILNLPLADGPRVLTCHPLGLSSRQGHLQLPGFGILVATGFLLFPLYVPLANPPHV